MKEFFLEWCWVHKENLHRKVWFQMGEKVKKMREGVG